MVLSDNFLHLQLNSNSFAASLNNIKKHLFLRRYTLERGAIYFCCSSPFVTAVSANRFAFAIATNLHII